MQRIFKVDPENPEKKLIDRASKIIKQGGLVIFPAKHLYGIAADALNPEAVKKIFDLKHRPDGKPLLILTDEQTDLKTFVKFIPLKAEILMEKFWPGDITLVFKANNNLPMVLTEKTGKIGIRMPWHPVAMSLVKSAGRPVTGTSANISGIPGCSSAHDLDPKIVQGVDMVMDAGRLKGGRGSTVVDVTVEPLKIIRKGELSGSDIFAALEQFY